jgi:O-methyltransferase involved in polyketide biosynthesis
VAGILQTGAHVSSALAKGWITVSDLFSPDLSGVAETLLIPLYNRAMESQRPDAIMKDEKAVALVRQMSYDFSQITKIRMREANKVARIMLTREIDRYTRDFLTRHPKAVVVHIGCGFDARFERVDNGLVEWYKLDLPEVIELRRKFIGDEGERYHLLACSVFEDDWLDVVKMHSRQDFMFLAETVLVYFSEAQVKSLFFKLGDHFPNAELVFEGWAPFFIWSGNRQLSRAKFSGLLRWGFWSSKSIKEWGEGIHLLGQWGFFDKSKPRMAPYRWLASHLSSTQANPHFPLQVMGFLLSVLVMKQEKGEFQCHTKTICIARIR